jgi:hypothetical protein
MYIYILLCLQKTVWEASANRTHTQVQRETIGACLPSARSGGSPPAPAQGRAGLCPVGSQKGGGSIGCRIKMAAR